MDDDHLLECCIFCKQFDVEADPPSGRTGCPLRRHALDLYSLGLHSDLGCPTLDLSLESHYVPGRELLIVLNCHVRSFFVYSCRGGACLALARAGSSLRFVLQAQDPLCQLYHLLLTNRG
jgi:hypothetical protein